MPEMTEYAPGTFCWTDLATTDPEASKRFYGGLFGWTAEDNPTDVGVPYTMFLKNGRPVAATYRMSPEMQAQNPHAFWQSYVSVADADAAAAKAQGLGAAVIMPAMDVMDVGRMAVIQDPAGAMFALWQPRKHIGAELVNEPGALCWNELYTNDPQASAAFYTALFGWSVKEMPGPDGEPYTSFVNGDTPAAGMMRIRPEWGEVPPNWSVYFAVESLDGAMARAQKDGARVGMGPMRIEGVGSFALLVDPQGTYFYAIELVMEG